LEYPLSKISSEEEFVRAAGTQGSEEPELRNTYVLSLIDNYKVEWRTRTTLEMGCKPIEHSGIRDYPFGSKPVPHILKNRPKRCALRLLPNLLSIG
jgi:hypothetical protein